MLAARARPLVLVCLAGGGEALFQGLLDGLNPTAAPISLGKKNFALPRHARLRLTNEAPPVYEIPGFLSEDECEALVEAADARRFPPVPYGEKNKIFTGTKYAAHKQDASVDAFLERACECFGCGAERFDPVTVTRYAAGEYQARHLDARLPHQINRDAAYMRTGGQRIAQLIVYLRAPEAGGGTKFYDGAFGGLTVAPEPGKALIFPTATLDGLADERYLHSGEPVTAGTKWIVGTWLMEGRRGDAAEVADAIEALWELDGGRPKAAPRAANAPPPGPAGGGARAAGGAPKAPSKSAAKRAAKSRARRTK